MKNNEELFRFVREHLHVAAISHILDSLSYRNQAMHQRIRPQLPNMRRCGFVGRARMVQWMETDYVVKEDP